MNVTNMVALLGAVFIFLSGWSVVAENNSNSTFLSATLSSSIAATITPNTKNLNITSNSIFFSTTSTTSTAPTESSSKALFNTNSTSPSKTSTTSTTPSKLSSAKLFSLKDSHEESGLLCLDVIKIIGKNNFF